MIKLIGKAASIAFGACISLIGIQIIADAVMEKKD